MSCAIELEIDAGSSPGEFRTRVVDAPSGSGASAVFQLDVDDLLRERDALENTVLASGASARRIVPAHEQQLRRVGQQLFEALFSERVLGTYRASLGVAQQRNEPLRVVLRLTAPRLAALPWEALFDPEIEAYLCRREPLMRHVPAPYTREPLEITPPLRVLGLVASPRGMPALDVAAEQKHLSDALATPIAEGLIELEWLTEASWDGVHERLLSNQWHVLHFIGHGDYDVDADQGLIALEGEGGRKDLVEAEQLADLLNEASPTPRLVVLNSCSSGEQGTQDLFSGTAAALVRSGINAVAAMQFTISDPAAIAFAKGFYTAIARGRSVDDASRSGRISMLKARSSLEWVTPVLYVRGESTQLFSLAPPERKGRRREKPLAQGTPEPMLGQPGQTPPPEPRPTVAAAQMRAMYVEARADLRAEHYDAAIGLLDDLLRLDPDYRDAAVLRDHAVRRRDLADKFQQAIDAHATNDWNTAARLYEQVLELEPGYRDAAIRREECEKAQRIIDLQDELRIHAESKNWQAVIDVSDELAALDPAAADPDGLATRARETLRAEAKADERKKHYTQAHAAEDAGHWTTAMNHYSRIIGYLDAETRLHVCQQRQEVAELKSRLDDLAKTEDWAQIHDAFTKLNARDPAAATAFAELDAHARSKISIRQKISTRSEPLYSFSVEQAEMLAWDPSGNRIAIANSGGWTYVYDLIGDAEPPAKATQVVAIQAESANSVTFSPDGTRLAIASHSKDKNFASIWDARTGKRLVNIVPIRERLRAKLLNQPFGPTWSAAFSPDGTRLATGSADNTFRVWDTRTGKELYLNQDDSLVWPGVTWVAFSPDGTRLATATADKSYIWDTRNWHGMRPATTTADIRYNWGTRPLTLDAQATIRSVAFSPDGTRLATGSDGKTARIWDTQTGQQLLMLDHGRAEPHRPSAPTAPGSQPVLPTPLGPRDRAQVLSVAFSPDGTRLATGNLDGFTGFTRIWDASTGELLLNFDCEGSVNAVAFSPDGHYVAALSERAPIVNTGVVNAGADKRQNAVLFFRVASDY